MNENRLSYWLENEYGKDKPSSEPVLDKVLEATDSLYVEEVDADLVYKNILARRDQNVKVARITSPKRIRLQWVISMAASLAIILLACVYLFKDIKINTSHGQQLVHVLPDNSKVYLNGNSRIQYGKDFKDSRVIELDGEAFFEVKKGQTFSVHTSRGDVSVLGTSFNVFQRDQSLIVACKTGRVKVSENEKSVILEPGLRARLDRSELLVDTISIGNIGTWSDGESIFDKTSLKDVVASLAAQYNLEVMPLPDNVKDELYNGSFVHNDLDKALKMVFLPMNVSYTLVDGNTLVVD